MHQRSVDCWVLTYSKASCGADLTNACVHSLHIAHITSCLNQLFTLFKSTWPPLSWTNDCFSLFFLAYFEFPAGDFHVLSKVGSQSHSMGTMLIRKVFLSCADPPAVRAFFFTFGVQVWDDFWGKGGNLLVVNTVLPQCFDKRYIF